MDLTNFLSALKDAVANNMEGRDSDDMQVVTSPPIDDGECDREVVGIEIVDDCVVLNLGRPA